MWTDLVGYTGRSMSRRFGLAALLAGLAVCCSSPPSKEHEQAEAALNAARAADAATYAPDELQAAEAALGKYDQAVAQKDYRQALSDAIDARDRGFDAARQAATQKAAARAELQSAITDVDTLIKTATARLSSSAGPRLAGPAADHLRAAVRTATTALQEARTNLDQQHYHDGAATLAPIADDLRKALAPPPGRRGRAGR